MKMNKNTIKIADAFINQSGSKADAALKAWIIIFVRDIFWYFLNWLLASGCMAQLSIVIHKGQSVCHPILREKTASPAVTGKQ